MKLIKKNRLSAKDINNINRITDISERTDGVKYSFYLGEDGSEDDIFILIYEDSRPVGFLCCFYSGISEISGLIMPEYRKRGFFKAALKAVPYTSFIFSGSDNYPNYSSVCIELGYNIPSHEYLMKYIGSTPKTDSCLNAVKCGSSFNFYKDEFFIGSSRYFEENTLINIYDVFVAEKFRCRGYGHSMINTLLAHFVPTGKSIILQVSENNQAAYRLYCACGFKVIDSVLYYSRLV